MRRARANVGATTMHGPIDTAASTTSIAVDEGPNCTRPPPVGASAATRAASALAAAAVERFGAIDAVFANAGFGGPGGFTGSDPDHWRDMVLTNVYGAALTVRATLDHLRSSKGHLLLTGSVAGRRAIPGSLYSCTKWAVTAMGEAVRTEVAGSGMRVTLIEPGIVATPFWDDGHGPIEHPLQEDDVARAVIWALGQPPHVDVNEILIRPTGQAG